MTENPKYSDPDFNEFWDQLIKKSSLAKDVAGKVAAEFKNLGVLKPISKPAQQISTEQSHSQSTSIPSPKSITFMHKFLLWNGIFIFIVVMAAGIYLYLTSPKQFLCTVSPVNWRNIMEYCFDKAKENIISGQATNADENSIKCDNGTVKKNGSCITTADFCKSGNGVLSASTQDSNTEFPKCICSKGSFWDSPAMMCIECTKFSGPVTDTPSACPSETSNNSRNDYYRAGVIKNIIN